MSLEALLQMVTETTNQAGFKGGGAETINPQIKKDYFKQRLVQVCKWAGLHTLTALKLVTP